jgi:hypothetical protein
VRLRIVLPPALLASLGAERSVRIEAILLHGEMPTKVLAKSPPLPRVPLVWLPAPTATAPAPPPPAGAGGGDVGQSLIARARAARIAAVAEALLALPAAEWGVHSQNGEDGIILALLHLLGGGTDASTERGVFFEFGVEDGRERNTRLLFEEHAWRGALLDGGHANASIGLHRHWIDAENVVGLMARYLAPLQRRAGGATAAATAAAAPGGAAAAAASNSAPGSALESAPRLELDLLSVDIDYNDYWVLKAVLEANVAAPKVSSFMYRYILCELLLTV